MNKKVFVKLIALLMAAAMLLGVCACSATDNNPTIGKIGKVKITLSQYQQIISSTAITQRAWMISTVLLKTSSSPTA